MSETYNVGNFRVNLDAIPAKDRQAKFQKLVELCNKLDELKLEIIRISGGKTL